MNKWNKGKARLGPVTNILKKKKKKIYLFGCVGSFLVVVHKISAAVYKLHLWRMGSRVHGLSSLIRHWTHVPCIARQILNHWTTREILSILDMYFLKVIPVSSEERCVQCLNVSQIILKDPRPFFFCSFFWKMEPKVFRPLSLLCFPPVYIFLFKFGNCWSRIRNQTRSSSKRNRFIIAGCGWKQGNQH